MSSLSDFGNLDLTNCLFGRWKVLECDKEKSKKVTANGLHWLCKCQCGNQKTVQHRSLTRGKSQSCGCLNREINAQRYPDLIGQVFGRWKVLELAPSKNNNRRYICECRCGNRRDVSARTLTNGTSKSCGCLHSEITSNLFLKDLTGQRFGRWLVLERDSLKRETTAVYWVCQCDCGAIVPVKGDTLSAGTSKSCGCLHREIVAEVGKAKRTHGETRTRLYNVWAGMKARCNDPNQPAYPNYGGRGIQVCDKWNEYEVFRDWALNNGYSDELTIERKDVNDNYRPENCCFITQKEQRYNKRTTIRLTAWGETKTLRDWMLDSRCCVVTESTLRTRYDRNQMTHEEMISTPPIRIRHSKRNRITMGV